MIGVNMPAIRPDATLDLTEAIEAFSYCMLASYNAAGVTGRAETSYRRSWGLLDINYFPRVAGGRPAFLIARYDLDPYPRAIVAIEGVSSISNYFNLIWGQGAVTVTGCAGRVFIPFANYAAEINTILADYSPFVVGPLVRQLWQITFAGFSMGAAIAEILANQWANTAAARAWKMFTFGKPRVGNYRWLANRNASIRGLNIVNNDDPVCNVPQTAPTRITNVFSSVPSIITAFQRDHWAQRFDKRGNQLSNYGDWQDAMAVTTAREAFRDINANNPWYDHQLFAYRLMLTNWAAQVNASTLYRFRHLELPDNNRWGPNYDGQALVDAELIGLNIPDPEDAPLPQALRTPDDQPRPLGRHLSLGEEAPQEVFAEPPPRINGYNVETTTQTIRHRRQR